MPAVRDGREIHKVSVTVGVTGKVVITENGGKEKEECVRERK